MLTTIREKTQGIIATFILALIGIPFALWGINSYFDKGSRVDVAKVNGEKISEPAYRTALEGFRRQLDPRMADNPEIKKLVVESLIDQTLLVHDAEDQGYRLGNERLARLIRELPYFQTGGRFDPEQYRNLLRRQGLSPAEFEQRQRTQVVTAQIQAGFAESGIVTDTDVAALLRLMRQEREVAYAVVGADKFLSTVTVTADAGEQYYKAHPELFTTAEQVRIEYVRLSGAELLKGYQPSEEELRRAYASDAAKNVRGEVRRVAHILIPVAAGAADQEAKKALVQAQDVERQAKAGSDFAKLANMYSADKDSAARGGDLGDVRPGLLPPPLEEAVFALKLGQVTKPVRSEFGYHVAKLTGFQPAVQKSFEELKPQLAKQLRQKKIEERFYEASEKFRNLVYEQSESLTPAAEALGLKVETSDWFGRNGGNGATALPKVIEAAFSPEVLTQGRNSDALDISGDTLIAIRVAGHRPAVAKPLADVRPQIERVLKQEAAQNAARELGETVSKEVTAGQSLEALARKHGLKYHAAKMVLRDLPQDFDRRVVEAAFRAARPESGKPQAGGVDLGTPGYAVFVVTRVKEGDPASADAATKDKARHLLAAHRGWDYYANYRAGLKQKADIKIYQDKL